MIAPKEIEKSYKFDSQWPYGCLQKVKTNQTRIISITSGKGGVGKTNIVANLAYTIAQLGKRVLVLDADLGLANIDILLGLTPRYTLEHVIMGKKHLPEVIVSGPGGMDILPASSGVEELTNLNANQREHIFSEFFLLNEDYDFLLIDTAAGISSNVICFNVAASEVINVIEPDPTSFTDAYALMKVLSMKYGVNHFKILLNSVNSEEEAKGIFEKIELVTNKFLNVTLEYLGFIFRDKKLKEAVRKQQLVVEIYPYARSSRCFFQLARVICKIPHESPHFNGFQRFIHGLFKREEL